MVGPALPMNKRKPGWLSNLLQSKFFDACADHIDLPKNEKKIFCIDSNLCCCKHCISSVTHFLHRYLRIWKCTYQDVVRLEDMQKHLDCSKIQTFKANGEKTVHLNPAPGSKHSTPLKSKSTTATGASCEACGRNIQDLPNCFCSVACKVLIDSSEILCKNQSQEMIAIPVLEFDGLSEKQGCDSESDKNEHESSRENQAIVSSALKPKGRLRKRKGVPCRAPFS